MKTKGQYEILPAADDHEASLVLGTNKSDDIVTGGGSQYIISGNGADVILAGGGPDIIEAGNGRDTVEGGGGPDIAETANGKDVLFGGLNRPGSSRHSEALNLGANRRCHEQQALPGRIQD